MQRILGIISGKGGVGKTTLAANIGFSIASQGLDTTLVDCNITTSHLGFLFGIYYYDKTLNDVLRGSSAIQEATYNYKNLKIIPASLALTDLINIDIEKIFECIRGIGSNIIILDSAPGIGREPMSVIQAANEIIFVTQPYLNSVTDVIRLNKIIEQLNIKVDGIVLNMVKGLPHELTKSEVEKLTGLEVIEEIPYDETVNYSLAINKPVVEAFPFSPASIAISRLSSKLTGTFYLPRRSIFARIKSGLLRLMKEKRVVNVKNLV